MTVTVTYDNQTPCCEAVSLLVYDDKGLDALFDARTSALNFTGNVEYVNSLHAKETHDI